MKRCVSRILATAAVAVFFVVGSQSCGSDGGLLPGLGEPLSLGTVEGPNQAEMAALFATTCVLDKVNCDGVIGPVVMSAGVRGDVESLPESHDDDLWALVYALLVDTFRNEGSYEINSRYEEIVEAVVPDELTPGQTVSVGPLVGVVDLNEACAPGTGSITFSFSHVYEEQGTPSAMHKGESMISVSNLSDSTLLQLANCTITGAIDDSAGDDSIVVSGTLLIESEFSGDSEDAIGSTTIAGTFTINPGEAAPEGDVSPIWGFNETVALDMEATGGWEDGMLLEPILEGGICYGGTIATAEGCVGIFISYQQLYDAERPRDDE